MVKNYNWEKIPLENEQNEIISTCFISTKYGNAYNSDAKLFLSFWKTDSDETYPILFPGD